MRFEKDSRTFAAGLDKRLKQGRGAFAGFALAGVPQCTESPNHRHNASLFGRGFFERIRYWRITPPAPAGTVRGYLPPARPGRTIGHLVSLVYPPNKEQAAWPITDIATTSSITLLVATQLSQGDWLVMHVNIYYLRIM
jgi:hypothetical protein